MRGKGWGKTYFFFYYYYILKFVLSLSLALLNSFAFLIVKKKNVNYIFFNIFQKYLLKKKNNCPPPPPPPPNLGLFSSRGGPRQCPNWPRPRAGPDYKGPFGLSLFLLKLKTKTENTVAK